MTASRGVCTLTFSSRSRQPVHTSHSVLNHPTLRRTDVSTHPWTELHGTLRLDRSFLAGLVACHFLRPRVHTTQNHPPTALDAPRHNTKPGAKTSVRDNQAGHRSDPKPTHNTRQTATLKRSSSLLGKTEGKPGILNHRCGDPPHTFPSRVPAPPHDSRSAGTT